MPGIRVLLAVIALVMVLSIPAAARTWLLNPQGTGDAPTIAAAIDSVALMDDIIELADGIYTGDGNRDLPPISKSVVIRSVSDDPTTCIIDLEGSADEPHHGFTFFGDG